MSFSATEIVMLLVPLGVITGLLSGMLGIGGGTLVVPALIIGLPHFGVAGADAPKIAIATSLALIIPTSIAGAQAHAARGAIDWRMAAVLAPGIAAGAFLTGAFAAAVNIHFVVVIFVAFTLFTAWRLASGHRPSSGAVQTSPCFVCMAVKGVGGGALSALLGIGVALFAVPMLARAIPLHRAIATAGALSLPMAVAGTAGYLIADAPLGCVSCTGYVFRPAVAAIGISAVLGAPIGVWVAHAVPVIVLRRLFAAWLVFAAGNLAYKSLSLGELVASAEHLAAVAAELTAPRAALPAAAEVPAWMEGRADMAAGRSASPRGDGR